jgi:hypothetical protein
VSKENAIAKKISGLLLQRSVEAGLLIGEHRETARVLISLERIKFSSTPVRTEELAEKERIVKEKKQWHNEKSIFREIINNYCRTDLKNPASPVYQCYKYLTDLKTTEIQLAQVRSQVEHITRYPNWTKVPGTEYKVNNKYKEENINKYRSKRNNILQAQLVEKTQARNLLIDQSIYLKNIVLGSILNEALKTEVVKYLDRAAQPTQPTHFSTDDVSLFCIPAENEFYLSKHKLEIAEAELCAFKDLFQQEFPYRKWLSE